jgi:uncharacterized protein (TIGR02058 family)
MSAKPVVFEFGMGVDVHGLDGTKAACRAVSDAIRHSSLPLFADVRARGGKMLVDVTVGIPDPTSIDIERVRKELPHGEVTVRPVVGGLKVPGSDTLIACVASASSACSTWCSGWPMSSAACGSTARSSASRSSVATRTRPF